MNRKYVVVAGSNLSDSRHRIERALAFIEANWKVLRRSGIYSTPDLLGSGMEYNNAVVEFEGMSEIGEVELALKNYERLEGRTPATRLAGKVPIDLDIVIYDEKVVRQKDFTTKYFKIGYSQL